MRAHSPVEIATRVLFFAYNTLLVSAKESKSLCATLRICRLSSKQLIRTSSFKDFMFSTHLNLILHSESSFLSTTLVTHYNLCTPVLATFASQNIISDCRSQDSDADENLSDTDGVLTDWSLDSDMDDQVLLMDRGECTCPNPKAHKRDCPLSIRSRGKRLFPSFKPGNKVAIHVQKFPGKHLVCRIAQVTNKRYTLCCKRGTLFQGKATCNTCRQMRNMTFPLTSGVRVRLSQ